MFALSELLVVAGILLAASLAFVLKKLNFVAAITGVIVALCIYFGGGITAIAMLAMFFVAGTWATGYRYKLKQGLNLSEENAGKRTAFQVIANGGVAAIAGLIALILPDQKPITSLAIAAALAAATSDTFSSELGNVFGKRFYNIVTMKHDTRGLNGVVSVEGTLFGVLGTAIIAVVYAAGYGWSQMVFFVFIAGIFGNLADSYLGAIFERKNQLGNNEVNFLNTAIAASIAVVLNIFFT